MRAQNTLIAISFLAVGAACGHTGNTIDLRPDLSTQSTVQQGHPVQVDGYNGNTQAVAPTPPPGPLPSPTPISAPIGSSDQPKADPTPSHLTLEASVHFDFGSSEIRDGDRAKIDDLLKSLARYSRISSIRIVGVSDPIGNMQNNLSLANARAEAVRDLLVRRSGELFNSALDKNLIAISSMTAQDNSCAYTESRAEKIACFEEDRRSDVVLEVEGTVVSQP